MTARSRASRASGPTASSDDANGIAPARVTRDHVGFNDMIPHADAGKRSEPAVSDPMPPAIAPVAIDIAVPDDEPPLTCAVFQGLRAWPRT